MSDESHEESGRTTLADFLTLMRTSGKNPARLVPRPADENPETTAERLAQAESGKVYEVGEETYFDYLDLLPPRFLRGSVFAFAEGSAPFLLFWRDQERGYLARLLTDAETDTFCALSGAQRYL